jgi:hypothetical protein
MGVNTQRKKGEKTPKGAAGNTETVSKQIDDLIEGLDSQASPIPEGKLKRSIDKALKAYKGKEKPKLQPTVKLIERKVPKGETPNMLDVAGGATAEYAAKGGLMKKKKSKKSSRLAKRGYGIAKRG